MVRTGEDAGDDEHAQDGTAHLGARKYLHPRRGLRRTGEVPHLSHRDAPGVEEGEDRWPRHVLHHGREHQGRCAVERQVQREHPPEGAAHPLPARAGCRGEHLQPSVPEACRVHQRRAAPEERWLRQRG